MRCLALAQAWQRRGGDVTFLTHCDNQALLARIREQGVAVIPISHPHPHLGDQEATVESVMRIKPVWVVLDGYHFDADFQYNAKKSLREQKRLLVIDDYGHSSKYTADMVLNQNLLFPSPDLEKKYGGDRGTKLLLGPRYALLRQDFSRAAESGRSFETDHKVLVTLGGSDPDNQTMKVVEALERVDLPHLSVVVIAGAVSVWKDVLAVTASQSRHDIKIFQDVRKIEEYMLWADVAVSAGGSTCWEMCCLGLPNIIVIIADNQREITEGLERYGASVSLGWFEKVSVATIAQAVEILLLDAEKRAVMSKKGKELVDGNGAARVVEVMGMY